MSNPEQCRTVDVTDTSFIKRSGILYLPGSDLHYVILPSGHGLNDPHIEVDDIHLGAQPSSRVRRQAAVTMGTTSTTDDTTSIDSEGEDITADTSSATTASTATTSATTKAPAPSSTSAATSPTVEPTPEETTHIQASWTSCGFFSESRI